jgi:hypothetical protein
MFSKLSFSSSFIIIILYAFRVYHACHTPRYSHSPSVVYPDNTLRIRLIQLHEHNPVHHSGNYMYHLP